ncbi:MAG: helix-turn-helix transcriptional regulator [Lachnospiraceae bacterium]|nr:helix-turn-helix transcriptional regulator [Lachnospiraceae bacterium]
MVDYSPLWETMRKRNVTTYTLIYKHNINPRTIYNLKHNKGINVATLENLCSILDCTPNDVLRFIPENN